VVFLALLLHGTGVFHQLFEQLALRFHGFLPR